MSIKSAKKIRRRGRPIIRKYVFILIMLLIVFLYMGGQYFFEFEWLTETVATILAIIAAVAFWLEYHENELLNEAQFIADLNEQFISNEHMSDVEWDLEKFYNKCKEGIFTEEFERKYDINKRERQYLINYLVHCEGVAALVKN